MGKDQGDGQAPVKLMSCKQVEVVWLLADELSGYWAPLDTKLKLCSSSHAINAPPRTPDPAAQQTDVLSRSRNAPEEHGARRSQDTLAAGQGLEPRPDFLVPGADHVVCACICWKRGSRKAGKEMERRNNLEEPHSQVLFFFSLLASLVMSILRLL